MDRLIKADLKNGMTSFMRVLVTLRSRNVEPTAVQIEGDKLIMSVENSLFDEALLNLSKVSDIVLNEQHGGM